MQPQLQPAFPLLHARHLCLRGDAVAIKWHRVLGTEDRTSKCQAQRELFIGATNNELRDGSFIRSSSLNSAWEHSSTGRFANRIAKSGDLLSSVLRGISCRRETRVSWTGEIIVSLDGCFCFPRHNFDPEFSRVIPQRGIPKKKNCTIPWETVQFLFVIFPAG